eukprot:GHVT01071629.1.p1 GENE.GHVT01071629.1~~GHVT01071629.1.p1  ORF type:complete len:102 (-),score=23.27 GHVT01071629.1:431-736(-)
MNGPLNKTSPWPFRMIVTLSGSLASSQSLPLQIPCGCKSRGVTSLSSLMVPRRVRSSSSESSALGNLKACHLLNFFVSSSSLRIAFRVQNAWRLSTQIGIE